MRIEDQVNTIEQGAKLKALGITMQPYLSWYRGAKRSKTRVEGNVVETVTDVVGETRSIWDSAKCFDDLDEIFPAYSAAEIMQMLCMSVGVERLPYGKMSMASWKVRTPFPFTGNIMTKITAGLAATLIHELETGHVTAAEVNARLSNA